MVCGDTQTSEMLMNWKRYLPLIVALLLGAGLKAILILSNSVPFNSDEAIVGLMARHIIQGEQPVFFYGQAYMGSLDAWLISFAFRLFGDSGATMRFLQALLYLIFVGTLWLLGRRLFSNPRVADATALLAAIPPVMVSLYTTATLGGYVESMIFGNLILLLGYELIYGKWGENWLTWVLLGLVCGLAFWTLGIAGIYMLPVGILGLLYFSPRRTLLYLLAAVGFLTGSLPWWLYNFGHEWVALAALQGPLYAEFSMGTRAFGLLFIGLPALLGLRFPWQGDYLPLPLSMAILLFYLGIGAYLFALRRQEELPLKQGTGTLLLLFSAGFTVIFIGSSFGADSTGRYLLPLYVPLVFAAGVVISHMWERARLQTVLVVLMLLSLNGASTWLAARSPEGLTTQLNEITRFGNDHDEELIRFLTEQGETRGYSNHWVSYRLAFLSDERIVLATDLPYQEDLSEPLGTARIADYTEVANAAPRAVYVTSKHPILDALLEEGFLTLGVEFEEIQIGPYHVYYDFSRKVLPEELGFGE